MSNLKERMMITIKNASLAFPGIIILSMGYGSFVASESEFITLASVLMIFNGLVYIFAMNEFINRFNKIEALIFDAIEKEQKKEKNEN